MLAKLRPPRPSQATVVAYLALFVALSTGGAYASHLVVDSSDVVDESLTGVDVQGKAGTSTAAAVNGSLTTHDIAGQPANSANGTPFIDGTLTQWDVKNSALTGGDLASNTVAAADIATNGVGASEIAAGAVGAAEIATGGVGADELGTITGYSTTISIPPGGGIGSTSLDCPEGERLLTGGAAFQFASGDISTSQPTFNGWYAVGQNNGNLAQTFRVGVKCLPPVAQTP